MWHTRKYSEVITMRKISVPFLNKNLIISEIYTEKTPTENGVDQLIYVTVRDKTTGNENSYSLIPSVLEIKEALQRGE